MDAKDVRSLFAYDSWANRRLLDAAGLLTPDAFTRDLGASFGSVRGTLLHVLWGEKRWLQRWVDGPDLPDPAPSDFPDCQSLAAAWTRLEHDRQAFAAELSDGRLQASMSVRGSTYTLAELIKHITNHSTYHRGQVVLLLRQLGHPPPATDYRLFLTETRAPAD